MIEEAEALLVSWRNLLKIIVIFRLTTGKRVRYLNVALEQVNEQDSENLPHSWLAACSDNHSVPLHGSGVGYHVWGGLVGLSF